jgi:DNA-binding response OmpR family regulator
VDAGADDYLVKPLAWKNCWLGCGRSSGASPAFQPTQLQVGDLLLDYGTSTVALTNSTLAALPLTTKEFQLLEYFMQHPNQILSRANS